MSVIETPLEVQIRDSQVSEDEAVTLHRTFTPIFTLAKEWEEKAKAIQVTSSLDKAGMAAAREARLNLQHIRLNAEKSRKALKEESLRKGKAIDAIYNLIEFIVVPLEKHLAAQENYAVLQEKRVKEELAEKRKEQLIKYNVDTSFYNLADMPHDMFSTLLETSQQQYALAEEARMKIENERIEREKAELAERERMKAENERLKKEAEERQKEIDAERAAKEKELAAERAAKEKVEAELLAKKKEEQRLEQEKKAEEQKRIQQEKEAEALRLKAEKQAKLAPDREKLSMFADRLAVFDLPNVTSEEAKTILANAVLMINDVQKYLKTQSISL
jgi:hypothetical protein